MQLFSGLDNARVSAAGAARRVLAQGLRAGCSRLSLGLGSAQSLTPLPSAGCSHESTGGSACLEAVAGSGLSQQHRQPQPGGRLSLQLHPSGQAVRASPHSAAPRPSPSPAAQCQAHPAHASPRGLTSVCPEGAQRHALPAQLPTVRPRSSSPEASRGQRLGSLWLGNPVLEARSILHVWCGPCFTNLILD